MTERPNKYPGPCRICGEEVPARAGLLVGQRGAWQVQHRPAEWHGSPVSGSWVGGCPAPALPEPLAPAEVPTTRERREARADRLREWADGRDAKSAADLDRAHGMAAGIPFGQPILVGHHSERRDRNYRERIASTMSRGVEHANKADEMRRKAENIEAAARRAIYTDDPDAIERLTAKLDALCAERDRIKAYNASCRKGAPDLALLAPSEREDVDTLRRVAAYQLGKNGALPGYRLSNLGATIRKEQQRLAAAIARRDREEQHQ